MLTVNTKTLGLIDVQMGDAEHAALRVNFPLNRTAGTAGGAVVYFEIQPGDYLATHTDSPEEILYIVSGSAEAQVGDERGTLSAGDLAVVPAMAPHSLRTIGDEPVKVVGFFSEPDVVSTFEEPVQPIGERVVAMAPVPVPA
jgi:quercetin dioxygenase-like cupin family protein